MVFLWSFVVLITVALGGTLGETLGWWFIWNRHSSQVEHPKASWNKAIVFLTGISDYAVQSLQSEQIEFVQEIAKKWAVDTIVIEPFPYDRLTAQTFARFEIWRHLGFKEPPLWAISLHNFWQTVLITGLERMYGDAVARCIINRIGLPTASESTLLFICGSTGASLALAAAPKLKERSQMRLTIISYGGVFRSSPGLDCVERFYHLIGEKDSWAKLGEFIFPGRWLRRGALERARQELRFSVHYTGKHKHMEYLSDRSPSPQAKTYRELTLDTIKQLDILTAPLR